MSTTTSISENLSSKPVFILCEWRNHTCLFEERKHNPHPGGPAFGDAGPPTISLPTQFDRSGYGVEAFHPHPADNVAVLAGPTPESPLTRLTMP